MAFLPYNRNILLRGQHLLFPLDLPKAPPPRTMKYKSDFLLHHLFNQLFTYTQLTLQKLDKVLEKRTFSCFVDIRCHEVSLELSSSFRTTTSVRHLEIINIFFFQVNLFSPSILSLHNEGHGFERNLSIPILLKAFQLVNDEDQNELLELIIETSGLSDAVQKVHVRLCKFE